MNYTVNPFLSGMKSFGRGFWNFCEVAGYARAAGELARQGLHKEAKACMMQVAKLRQAK
jgi:hypothetical protein